MLKTDVVIIGAGPVGMFMVFQLGMLGMKSVVVDVLGYVGGQCSALYPEKPIYDIPAYPKILASELVDQLQSQIKPFSPHFLLGSAVNDIIRNDSGYKVCLDDGREIEAKAIVVAAGSGEFSHKKPPIDDIAVYEGKSIFYNVSDKSIFKNKEIVIAGGGDSAVDWAIELSSVAKHVHVIHRRDKFKCMQASYEKLINLSETEKLSLHIPYQLSGIRGEAGILEAVEMVDFEGKTKLIPANYLIALYGLAMNLDKIKNWGLEIQKNLIVVDPASMLTNLQGIYAIGDICSYPGKLKLILCGFSEAAIAAHNCYNIVFPDKALHFEYSTSKGVI